VLAGAWLPDKGRRFEFGTFYGQDHEVSGIAARSTRRISRPELIAIS